MQLIVLLYFVSAPILGFWVCPDVQDRWERSRTNNTSTSRPSPATSCAQLLFLPPSFLPFSSSMKRTQAINQQQRDAGLHGPGAHYVPYNRLEAWTCCEYVMVWRSWAWPAAQWAWERWAGDGIRDTLSGQDREVGRCCECPLQETGQE